jgi:hypothetical protein
MDCFLSVVFDQRAAQALYPTIVDVARARFAGTLLSTLAGRATDTPS